MLSHFKRLYVTNKHSVFGYYNRFYIDQLKLRILTVQYFILKQCVLKAMICKNVHKLDEC